MTFERQVWDSSSCCRGQQGWVWLPRAEWQMVRAAGRRLPWLGQHRHCSSSWGCPKGAASSSLQHGIAEGCNCARPCWQSLCLGLTKLEQVTQKAVIYPVVVVEGAARRRSGRSRICSCLAVTVNYPNHTEGELLFWEAGQQLPNPGNIQPSGGKCSPEPTACSQGG